MSGDDELERLLREVDATLTGPSKVPATQGKAQAPVSTGTGDADPASRGRVATGLRTGVVAGAVCGVGVSAVAFFFSWLPFDQSPLNSGMGAFVGAFLTGAVLGARRPPA